jgi:hypothetical protein
MIDLIVYGLICIFLVSTAILSAKYWGVLGVFGAVIGAIFSLIVFDASELAIRTVYVEGLGWVSQSIPLGFFAYIPLILTGLNVIVAIKK